MALFCAAIRRDSVSLLKFPFLSHVQVFSYEILLFFHIPVSEFVIFLLIFLLFVLFLVAVINLSLLVFMPSWNPRIYASTLFSKMMCSFPSSFFDIYCLSMPSLWCKELAFLFSDSLVEVLSLSILRIVPSILQGGQPRYLSLWWNSCCRTWFLEVFSFV